MIDLSTDIETFKASRMAALVDLDDATLLAMRPTGGSESRLLVARPPPPRDVASSAMGMYDRRQGRRCALRAEQSVQSEPFFKRRLAARCGTCKQGIIVSDLGCKYPRVTPG